MIRSYQILSQDFNFRTIAQLGSAGVQQAQPREQLPVVAPAHGLWSGGGGRSGGPHGRPAR